MGSDGDDDDDEEEELEEGDSRIPTAVKVCGVAEFSICHTGNICALI